MTKVGQAIFGNTNNRCQSPIFGDENVIFINQMHVVCYSLWHVSMCSNRLGNKRLDIELEKKNFHFKPNQNMTSQFVISDYMTENKVTEVEHILIDWQINCYVCMAACSLCIWILFYLRRYLAYVKIWINIYICVYFLLSHLLLVKLSSSYLLHSQLWSSRI